MGNDAEDARFAEFVRSTVPAERDWIAFVEFEHEVRSASRCAAIVNPFDDPKSNVREVGILETAIGQMFFRALPRFSLGALVANAEGLGYAVRFGLVEARPEGLDGVADDEALAALAARGADAVEAFLTEHEHALAERVRRKGRGRPGKRGSA